MAELRGENCSENSLPQWNHCSVPRVPGGGLRESEQWTKGCKAGRRTAYGPSQGPGGTQRPVSPQRQPAGQKPGAIAPQISPVFQSNMGTNQETRPTEFLITVNNLPHRKVVTPNGRISLFGKNISRPHWPGRSVSNPQKYISIFNALIKRKGGEKDGAHGKPERECNICRFLHLGLLKGNCNR